jgi:serine/threonine protein kinase
MGSPADETAEVPSGGDARTGADGGANGARLGAQHLPTEDVDKLRRHLRSTPDHPEWIGPYRILGALGAGGMGQVYKAERRQPIRQTVAIKVIKLGFDSREVVARFESERQALARMDHPGIAKVLDAGVSESGRPFFVMEFVPGVPITKFADDNKLTVRQRLELFIQVCEAINHAHTKSIIHRDIKAKNVLAYLHDGRPTVKVIDFGIAKALTGDRLTDATFNTGSGAVIGTYESMSPEQADGSPDIDTRTDVYALGVLLYELLSGSQPFDLKTLAQSGDFEIRRIIREVEPPRPSTRLSTSDSQQTTRIAQLRRLRLDQLTRDLRRELEWIPLKAMRKERDRRYATAIQVADDVRNYLDGRPLIAGPETRRYRLRKWAAKHRVGLIAATSMVSLVTAGIVVYIRDIQTEKRKTEQALHEAQLQQARAEGALGTAQLERQRAEVALKEAENQRSRADKHLRLFQSMFDLEALRETQDRTKEKDPLAALLLRAIARVQLEFGDEPETRAELQHSMGRAITLVGRIDMASDLLGEALEERRRVLGPDNPKTLHSLSSYAYVLSRLLQRNEQAEPLLKELFERRTRVSGPNHADTIRALNDYAVVLKELGRPREAEQLARDAWERHCRVLGDEHPDTLNALNNYGDVLLKLGRTPEAERLLKQALVGRRRALGPDHRSTIISLNNYGRALTLQGRFAEAEDSFGTATESARRVLGDFDAVTLKCWGRWIECLRETGRTEQADEQQRLLGAVEATTRPAAANP